MECSSEEVYEAISKLVAWEKLNIMKGLLRQHLAWGGARRRSWNVSRGRLDASHFLGTLGARLLLTKVPWTRPGGALQKLNEHKVEG